MATRSPFKRELSRLFFLVRCLYIVKKIIHGCSETWNFSLSVQLDVSLAGLTRGTSSWTLEEKLKKKKKESNGNLCGTSTAWLFVHWNIRIELEFGNVVFLRRGENRSTRGKTSRAEKRTKNKLNPHMASSPRIDLEPHWWEASALTNAPSLLPTKKFPISACQCHFILYLLHRGCSKENLTLVSLLSPASRPTTT